MTSSIEKLIKEVLELDEKATKGPWHAIRDADFRVWEWDEKNSDEGFTVSPSTERLGWETDSGCEGYGLSENNAQCMAKYRTAAPRLARVCEIMDLRLSFLRNRIQAELSDKNPAPTLHWLAILGLIENEICAAIAEVEKLFKEGGE